MSMSDASEAALLDLLFLNVAWPNVGNAGGLQPAGVAGSFYIALHTADPGDAGSQATSEAAYTGYARVAVPRAPAGFTRNINVISNTGAIQFGDCTAGSAVVTHFSVGTAASGAGSIIYSGPLSASRSISAGITPLFNAGALTGTVD